MLFVDVVVVAVFLNFLFFAFKHGRYLYKEPRPGRAVSHFILDVNPSTPV